MTKVLQMTMVQKPHYNGVVRTYKFKNGYGCSVICHDGSYGGPYKGKHGDNRWEIAPLGLSNEFVGASKFNWGDDVMGHLEWREVDEYLEKIAAL